MCDMPVSVCSYLSGIFSYSEWLMPPTLQGVRLGAEYEFQSPLQTAANLRAHWATQAHTHIAHAAGAFHCFTASFRLHLLQESAVFPGLQADLKNPEFGELESKQNCAPTFPWELWISHHHLVFRVPHLIHCLHLFAG